MRIVTSKFIVNFDVTIRMSYSCGLGIPIHPPLKNFTQKAQNYARPAGPGWSGLQLRWL